MEDHITDFIEEYKDFNKELEEKILEANQDDTKVKWHKLLPELMAADIFIAAVPMEGNSSPEQKMNILMLRKGNHTIIPFFTSSTRFRAVTNAQISRFDVMKVNTVRFFQSIAGNVCVLNPLTEYSHVFSAFDVKVLAAENIDKAPPLPEKHEEAACEV